MIKLLDIEYFILLDFTDVEEATPDLQNSTASVKGSFDPLKLGDYVYMRTGKHATIVKIDPPPPTPAPKQKEAEGSGKDGKEENKADDSNKGVVVVMTMADLYI